MMINGRFLLSPFISALSLQAEIMWYYVICCLCDAVT